MSLKDTIAAARREAQEAGSVFVGKEKEAEAESESASSASGFSKRSTARAKPTSSAASSVRVISAEDAKQGKTGKKPSEMTKEERKAERDRVRDADDLRNAAANILLKRDKGYQRVQRVWWIMVLGGLAMTFVSFGINWWMNHTTGEMDVALANNLVVVAMVTLVLAYACIIGGFIYDMVKGRPIRKSVDAEVKRMTKKRLEALVREDAEEQAEKKAAKKAK